MGPGSEEKWYGTCSHAQKGRRGSTAMKMVQRFKEKGHPVFKSISAMSRGFLEQKKGESTIHFNGDSMDTELLLQTINSFCKSAQCLRSNDELVSSTRNDRERKGTSQFLCGQQDVDKFENGRNATLGVSSDNSNWKQDASQRVELRSTDKQNTVHIIVRKNFLTIQSDYWENVQRSTRTRTTVEERSLFYVWNTPFFDLFLNPRLCQSFPKAQLLDKLWMLELRKFLMNVG